MTRIVLVILATVGALSVTGSPTNAPTNAATNAADNARADEPAAGATVTPYDRFGALEDAIVEEHNLARQNPKAYVQHLAILGRRFEGKMIHFPGEPSVITQEGVKAVTEAIQYLLDVNPLPPLTASKGISRAAEDHVLDQGPRGATGHDGSDGSKPWDRVARYGKWDVVVGENISYGPDQARRVVMGLIIDDGVPDRGHRHNIFSPEFRFIGVACGPHFTFRTMCTIDYAADFLGNSLRDEDRMR